MIRRIGCSSAALNSSSRVAHQSQRQLVAASMSMSRCRALATKGSSDDASKPPRRSAAKKGKANVNINDVIAANNSFDGGAASSAASDEAASFDMASLRNRRDTMDSDIALDGATVVKFLQERRLDDVLLVDVSRKCSWTDAMVFATGKSERQMVAAANALVKEYREIIPTCAEDRRIMETDEHWVALDCGLVVVHLFTAHGRALYGLDKLWIERPDLNEAGFLAEGVDANRSAQDDYEDDPATEAAIAAAADAARLDPATFGLAGAAASETRARVVVHSEPADGATPTTESVAPTTSTDAVARPRRKLVRGLLASRMAANGVWPPSRSVTVSDDD